MQEQYNTRQLLSLGAVIALTPALRLFPAQAAQLAGIGSRNRLRKEEPNMCIFAKARALHTGR